MCSLKKPVSQFLLPLSLHGLAAGPRSVGLKSLHQMSAAPETGSSRLRYPGLTPAHNKTRSVDKSRSILQPGHTQHPLRPIPDVSPAGSPRQKHESRWLASSLTALLSGLRALSAVGTRITWGGTLWLTRASVLIRPGGSSFKLNALPCKLGQPSTCRTALHHLLASP